MANSSAEGIFAGQPTQDLLSAHKTLRQELSSITHWHRLIRARMDLATANAAPPLPLGGGITEFIGRHDLEFDTTIDRLPTRILTNIEGLAASSLPELKALEDALRTYERNVRSKYMALSEELSQRHATYRHL